MVGPGLGASPVTATLAGLLPGKTYHYRLTATSSDGTTTGADKTLETKPDTTPPDTTPPALLSASVSPTPFSTGTTFKYRLSEAANVVFTIARQSKGRKVGAKCKKQTKSNKTHKKCKRFKPAGSLAQQSTAGNNAKPFSGRIGTKRLKPGTYRLTLVATDPSGNKSPPKRLKFKIRKKLAHGASLSTPSTCCGNALATSIPSRIVQIVHGFRSWRTIWTQRTLRAPS